MIMHEADAAARHLRQLERIDRLDAGSGGADELSLTFAVSPARRRRS